MAKDPAQVFIENLVLIQRAGNTYSREAQRQIREAFDEILAVLIRFDPTSVQTRYQAGRIQKILERVKQTNRSLFDALSKEMRAELGFWGSRQVGFAKESLIATLGAGQRQIKVVTEGLSPTYFRKILDAQPFRGATLGTWFEDLADSTTGKVSKQIKIGMVNNETIGDLVRRIRGRSVGGGRYRGGVMATTTRNATTIVRTAVNEIANRAHLDVYRQNDDITTGYEYVATLDSRTTLICARLDGTVFSWDDERALRPPQHPNCRSATVPVIDWEGIGVTPPNEGTRASSGGSVSASTDYESWLRKQPKSVQAEVLGKGRAELFSDGKITLRDAVRRDGTIVPLETLRG